MSSLLTSASIWMVSPLKHISSLVNQAGQCQCGLLMGHDRCLTDHQGGLLLGQRHSIVLLSLCHKPFGFSKEPRVSLGHRAWWLQSAVFWHACEGGLDPNPPLSEWGVGGCWIYCVSFFVVIMMGCKLPPVRGVVPSDVSRPVTSWSGTPGTERGQGAWLQGTG